MMASLIRVNGLPGAGRTEWELTFRAAGFTAYLKAPTFIARFSLETGDSDWVVERAEAQWADSIWTHPRPINICGSDLWASAKGDVVAELLPTEEGEVVVSARDARTGSPLWERLIPIPEAAEWAESPPAREGAPTEEAYAFFGDDADHLVFCLFRQSRRSGLVEPGRNIDVLTLPPYACQTDASRFDLLTGETRWSATFPDAKVGMLERTAFTGPWSHESKLGVIDFASGKPTTVYESSYSLSSPLRDGPLLAVPWHTKKTAGVDWVDAGGNRVRQAAWECGKVRSTQLHATEGGFALQTNDQSLWWLGNGEAPLFRIRAKPYICNVHRFSSSDVFVGTDGQGGRLFAYDAVTGAETLNFRPVSGGAAMIVKPPGYETLLARFATSKRGFWIGRVYLISMATKNQQSLCDSPGTLWPWQHGAVCVTSEQGPQLTVVDIRD